MNQNYLMINKDTNIVDNVCLWNGDVNTWQPPSNYLMLIQSTIPAIIWQAIGENKQITDWVLQEVMGAGQTGFTWDGSKLTTNQPKPEIPVYENTNT